MVLTREDIIGRIEVPLRSPSRVRGSERHGLMPSVDSRIRGQIDELDAIDGALAAVGDDFDWGYLKIKNIDESNMGDVAVDLRVGTVVFETDVIPADIYGMNDLLSLERQGKIKRLEKNSDGSFLLNPDENGRRIYLVPSLEEFVLPSDLSMVVDAKSTTGRVFAMCNDRTSGVKGFGDNNSYQPVIASVQPFAFPLIIHPGKTSLYQAAIRYKNSSLMTPDEIRKDSEIVRLWQKDEEIDLQSGERFRKDGIVMTYDTSLVLRARTMEEIKNLDPIDMDLRRDLNGEDYFEIIEGDGEYLLESNRSHLLGTLETIGLGSACGHLSRETDDTGTGMYGHFAGKIQPGYLGRITMEVLSYVSRNIRRGTHAAQVQIDQMTRDLREGEGYSESGFYTNQKQIVPQFPKMFKQLGN